VDLGNLEVRRRHISETSRTIISMDMASFMKETNANTKVTGSMANIWTNNKSSISVLTISSNSNRHQPAFTSFHKSLNYSPIKIVTPEFITIDSGRAIMSTKKRKIAKILYKSQNHQKISQLKLNKTTV